MRLIACCGIALALLAAPVPAHSQSTVAQSTKAKQATKQVNISKDVPKLERYLRKLFGNQTIRVTFREKRPDSAEVYVRDEFIGVVFADEDGDFSLQMAILAVDLQ